MYDGVRIIILGIFFAGLLALWIWSKRQAALRGVNGKNSGSSFKILQKRWIDQKTGVCLIEAEEQTFMLAYTVSGGVSWQPVEKAPAEETKPAVARNFDLLLPEAILAKAGRQ